MIDLLDLAIFLILTGATFVGLTLIRAAKTGKQPPQQRLSRDPLKIKIVKKTALDSYSKRIDRWIIQLLRRGGLRLDRVAALLLILCSGLLTAATAFVFELPILVQILSAICVVLLGLCIYHIFMWRRIRKFNKQFPIGLELMARACRAGESIEDSFVVANQSNKQPVKGEFQICLRQLQLGLPVDVVVKEFAERVGTSDLKLFSHTLAIHRSIGGPIAESLERLSRVIRDRAECVEKIKSATGLGRFAVGAIVTMGFLVFVYLITLETDYIGRLTQSDLGQKMIAYAAISEVIGLAWVVWTLNSEP